MKTIIRLCWLSLGVICCTKSPEPALEGNTKALLNEQPWSGQATTWQSNPQSEPCTANTFNLGVQNNLPYPQKARLQAPSNCVNCADQWLTFTKIPLAVGQYNVSTHQPCPANPKDVGVSYTTLIGGDVIRDQYQLDSTKVGTITLTKYDPQAGEVEGTFEVNLVRDATRTNTSNAAETVYFRNGSFKAKLP